MARGFWLQKSNQKKFFESFAKKHNIQNPEDWGKINTRQFLGEGGAFITHYFSGSLYKSLQSVFPDTKWNLDWFVNIKRPSRFWLDKNNQRKFFDDLAKKFEISKPSQWNKISLDQIEEEGGVGLLRYYGRNMYQTLSKVYPEVEWKKDWFLSPKGYWKNISNQSVRFESLRQQFKIKSPRDWGKVTIEQIKLNGGDGLLSQYDYSLYNALKSTYPDVKWKRHWFKVHSDIKWRDPTIQQSFLQRVAAEGNITTISDWKKIGLSIIRQNGGNGLLSYYKQSLARLISSNFPEFEMQFKEMSSFSSIQNQLELDIKAMIPGVHIVPNWRKGITVL